MKKTLIYKIVISTVVIAFLVGLILKPRGYKRMEKIANNEFRFLLQRNELEDKLKDFKRVPLRETENREALIFPWMYFLETGDTAMVYIEVRKQVYPWENKESDIYMNHKWRYLFKSERSIFNALPNKYKGDSLYSGHIASYMQNDEYFTDNDTLKLHIPTKKLFSFLKEGYFNVLQRYDNYTVVAFYEPIASIISGNKNTPIKTAKIFFNDRNEVFIIPYDAPQELWDNYNKE